MNEVLVAYLSLIAANTYGCNVYGGGSYSQSECDQADESPSPTPQPGSDTTTNTDTKNPPTPTPEKPSTSPKPNTNTGTIHDTNKPTMADVPVIEPVVLAAVGSVFVASGLMFFLARIWRKKNKS